MSREENCINIGQERKREIKRKNHSRKRKEKVLLSFKKLILEGNKSLTNTSKEFANGFTSTRHCGQMFAKDFA